MLPETRGGGSGLPSRSSVPHRGCGIWDLGAPPQSRGPHPGSPAQEVSLLCSFLSSIQRGNGFGRLSEVKCCSPYCPQVMSGRERERIEIHFPSSEHLLCTLNILSENTVSFMQTGWLLGFVDLGISNQCSTAERILDLESRDLRILPLFWLLIHFQKRGVFLPL